MPDLSNTFLAGVMNKDLDERLLPPGTYRDALNVDIDTADGGNIGAVKNKAGNTLMANIWNVAGFPYPQTTNARTIGAVTSDKDGFIYWFVTSDQFDGIYEYNIETQTTVRVLQSNKPTPTSTSKLNFNKEYIITGVNYISGFLYWTDNLNPPRRINISRVKSNSTGTGGYTIDDPRMDEDLNVILAPPLNAPKLTLINNTSTQSNNMDEKFLYFSYRYKYVDDQYSSLSPFSAVAFQPKDYEIDYRAGNNKSMVNRFNQAQITVFTGNQFVKEVQVIMRDARSLNAYIVETFDKEDLNIGDNVFRSFEFNNNKTYTVLPADQVTRLFDNVPLLAKAQDFVGNRIMYGNYTQFYDIEYPVSLEASYSSIGNAGEIPIQTFRSDRDYELGIIYTDEYGRSTTALTSQNNTVYIPPTKSTSGNSLILKIKNRPPSWATNYRVVIKQAKDKYYNIFPLYVYSSSNYRYFLINESDRDKIKTGDYLIFKSDANGPTYSNKKYKILEIKDKSAGFITSAPAGLYFKLKVDSPSELNAFLGTDTAYFTGNGYAPSTDWAWVNTVGINVSILNPPPVKTPNGAGSFAMAEKAIHYGVGNPNALSVYNDLPWSSGQVPTQDYRITIQALNNDQFSYTTDLSGFNPTILNINYGNSQVLYYNNIALCAISWNLPPNTPTVGDVWKVNVRGTGLGLFIKNYFGGKGIPKQDLWNNDFKNNGIGGYAVLGESNPSLQQINQGDIISIQITEDSYNSNVDTSIQSFPPSPETYENIEEWFVESGAYLQFDSFDLNGNVNSKSVSFRRGTSINYVTGSNPYNYIEQVGPEYILTNDPMYMIILGYGKDDDNVSAEWNIFSANLTIRRIKNQIIAETSPTDSEIEVFHELSRTFKIKNDLHAVSWSYKNYSSVTAPSQYAGKTRLGQLNPNSTPTSTDDTHNFIAGERIYVQGVNINGYYNILYVYDQYNIIIDLNFPGLFGAGNVFYDAVEQNQTSYGIAASSATIKINNPGNTINSDFNAWSYTNALETMRIRDDLNAATLEYSPRTTTEIDNYEQKVSKNSICYSGVFNDRTSFNALNEFNLSKANFKYLDGEFGSIQKLYARDTDLLVFQEDKVSSVLYGKNLLSDAVGGGQVVSVPEVLGTQIAFPGEYGISMNPESFAVWGTDIYFTDAKRGVVIGLIGNQMAEISANGMQDYFIELMRDFPNTQKLGCYDPHNQTYVLASNDISILNCNVKLNRYSKNVASNTSTFMNNLFTIIGDVSWTLSIVNLGSGTNWVSNYQTFGYGTTDINAIIAQNLTGSNRSVKFVITYCGGKTLEFILTQGAGEIGNIINVVIHNPIKPNPPIENPGKL